MKKIVFLILVISLLLVSFRTPATYPLDNLPIPEFAYGLRRLSEDYQGNYVLTIGNKISTWYDQSGNSTNLQQLALPKQPTQQDKAVYFDGIDDFLIYPDGFPANQLTLVAAVSIVNPTLDNPIITLAWPYSPNKHYTELGNTGIIGGFIFGFVYGGKQAGWNYPGPSSTVIVSYVADEITGIYTFRLNGVKKDEEQGGGNWGNAGNYNEINVGRLIAGDDYYKGLIYELYGWSVILTDTQLATLEQNIANFIK